MELEQVREEFHAAVRGVSDPADAANRLCRACVEVLEVDGAAVSLVLAHTSQGTLGSSGDLSRELNEFQYTFGEGPCFEAVADGAPVLVADLADPGEQRWPAFGSALLREGINAVFALPVSTRAGRIGALDLFRKASGSLSDRELDGGILAAEFAALPLMALMTSEFDDPDHASAAGKSDPLASLDRVEIYQATGMIIAALDVDADEALVRLRAHAFASGMTANEVAWEIIERRLSLDNDRGFRERDRSGGTP